MSRTNLRIASNVQPKLQIGHPLFDNVRSLILADHSWSGPSGHIHQTFLLLPATTSAGVRSPFFVGCHSAAISEEKASSEFVTDTRCPAQHGHPLFDNVRSLILADHSWSGPSGHIHQTFLLLPATTSAGVRSPFFVGCHSAAISEEKASSEFVIDTRCPAQHGHPVPKCVRLTITAGHSWSGPSGHIHQTFL